MKCAAVDEVQAHVNKMFNLITDLASYGYEVNNINMKSMLLDSLPDLYEFEQLRGAVKYGGYGGTLTLDELRVLIEKAADRQSRRRSSGRGSRGRRNGGEHKQGGNHGGSGCDQSRDHHGNGGGRQRSGGSSNRNQDKACFNYSEAGHFKANCPERDTENDANNGTRQSSQRQNRTNLARSHVKRQRMAQCEPGAVTGAAEEAYGASVNMRQLAEKDAEMTGPSPF